MSVYQVTLKTASGRLDVMRIIAADRLAAMEIANRTKLSAEFLITDCHARKLAETLTTFNGLENQHV
jgi:hypothetical protein